MSLRYVLIYSEALFQILKGLFHGVIYRKQKNGAQRICIFNSISGTEIVFQIHLNPRFGYNLIDEQ